MTTYYYLLDIEMLNKMCVANRMDQQNSVKNMSNNKIATCKSIIILFTILFLTLSYC